MPEVGTLDVKKMEERGMEEEVKSLMAAAQAASLR
jgi:hypothetical protein